MRHDLPILTLSSRIFEPLRRMAVRALASLSAARRTKERHSLAGNRVLDRGGRSSFIASPPPRGSPMITTVKGVNLPSSGYASTWSAWEFSSFTMVCADARRSAGSRKFAPPARRGQLCASSARFGAAAQTPHTQSS
jgi:hypothetical protein